MFNFIISDHFSYLIINCFGFRVSFLFLWALFFYLLPWAYQFIWHKSCSDLWNLLAVFSLLYLGLKCLQGHCILKVISFSIFLFPCLAILRLHSPASLLTSPTTLIQNHVSYWWFQLLFLSNYWWGYCRISHQVREWLGLCSCCIVVWVFTCLLKRETYISNNHRQWLVSILSPFQTYRDPKPTCSLKEAKFPESSAYLCMQITTGPSDVLLIIGCFRLLFGLAYLNN